MNSQKMKAVVKSVLTLTCLAALFVAAVSPATAQTLTTLYTFGTGANGGLLLDAQGNLYGTTAYGGTNGNGTVFELSAAGVGTVLYSFQGGTDGRVPTAGLVRDAQGNLYGTTYFGGSNISGTVFKLSPAGTETLLHSFIGPEGYAPESVLALDVQGNLFGTASKSSGNSSAGTVFEIAADGTEKDLYRFQGKKDGAYPVAGLVRDAQGNFYGATFGGGLVRGTVFKLTPNGTHTVLYNFKAGTDGAHPWGDLVRDAQGNLYGTTYSGGTNGFGTVFELTAAGVETVLYNFKGNPDGKNPTAGLVRDAAGNLYGVAKGGTFKHGLLFEITTAGKEIVLHDFSGGADGGFPSGKLVMDAAGVFYGATGYGTVFKLTIP